MMAFQRRWVEGKRVAKVETAEATSNNGARYQHVERIVFDDGSMIYFQVMEEEDDYGVRPIYYASDPTKPKPRKQWKLPRRFDLWTTGMQRSWLEQHRPDLLHLLLNTGGA